MRLGPGSHPRAEEGLGGVRSGGSNELVSRLTERTIRTEILSASEELPTPCITPHNIIKYALLHSYQRAHRAPIAIILHPKSTTYSHLTVARYTFR